jgi:putative membrane protein
MNMLPAPALARAKDGVDGTMDDSTGQDVDVAPARDWERSRVNDLLANERTLLAWTRTSIAVMALGFVVARFGFVLRDTGSTSVRQLPSGVSTAFGTVLVLLGTVVLVLAAARFLHLGNAIVARRFDWSPRLGLVLAFVLAVVGLLLAIYIIVTG